MAPVSKAKAGNRGANEEFELKDRLYLLKGDATPLRLVLRSKHSASKPLLHFDGKRNKALRWSNNQSSPYLEDQDGYAICPPIIFDNGKLFVKKEDVELQKFLSELHPDRNTVYYEYDAEAQADAEYELLNNKLEAQIQAKEMAIEDLEAVARVVLKKGKVDTLGSSELRRDMIMWAGQNPTEFISLANDEGIKFRNIAVRAVDMGIIKVSKDGRNVMWASGDKIITVPFGENYLSALASYFLTDEGMEVLSGISNKL